MVKKPKRTRDANQLVKFILDAATGERDDKPPPNMLITNSATGPNLGGWEDLLRVS